jgi:hypothetical protein
MIKINKPSAGADTFRAKYELCEAVIAAAHRGRRGLIPEALIFGEYHATLNMICTTGGDSP